MIRRKVPPLGGKSLTNSFESNEFGQAVEREETYRIISLTMNLYFTFFSSDGEQLDFQGVLNSQYEKKKIIHRNISQQGFLEIEQKEIRHIITILDEYGWDTDDIRYIAAIDYLHWIENEERKKFAENEILDIPTNIDDNSYFTTSFTEEEQKHLYDNLKKKYISKETRLEDFCFVFGGKVKPDNFKPIEWTKTQALLTYLVHQLFGETSHYWDISSKLFSIKGNPLNTDSMKTYLTKCRNGNKYWDSLPRGAEELKKIILY